MGWWDDSIMGGDEPLDDYGDFMDIFGLSRAEKSGKEAAQTVNKGLPKVLEKIGGRKGVGGQVLGVIIMEAGAHMSRPVKKFILDCLDEDEWAQECADRKEKVKAFRKQVEAYDGSAPVPCPAAWGRGLFEKLDAVVSGRRPPTPRFCPACGQERSLFGGWDEYREGPYQIELAPDSGLYTVSVFTCSLCDTKIAFRRPD